MARRKQGKARAIIQNMATRIVIITTKRKVEDRESKIYKELIKINKRRRNKKMGKTIAKILKKLVSEETLIGILLVVGDYVVELSSNELDNKVWDKVKKQLEKK